MYHVSEKLTEQTTEIEHICTNREETAGLLYKQ